MNDVAIRDGSIKFKFRVCIVLKVGDKILVEKLNQNKFYCLPGGHVELGESTYEGVIREAKEELELDIIPEKLLVINENFFGEGDKKYHELAYYYLCRPSDISKVKTENYIFIENDKGYIVEHHFTWVDKETLQNIDFKPESIKEFLINNDRQFGNIITKY